MKKTGKIIRSVILSAVLLAAMVPAGTAAAAEGMQPIAVDHTASAVDGTTNQWTITLNVKGSTITQNPNADIVLVLDRSGSMKKTDTTDKMGSAQSAARDFVGSVLTPSHPNAKIALVSFGSSAAVDAPLTGYAGESGLEDKISALKADGGTNIQDGLHQAKAILDADAGVARTSKYIVLLSDGEPTYSFRGTSVVSASPAWSDGSASYDFYIRTFDYTAAGRVGTGEVYALPQQPGQPGRLGYDIPSADAAAANIPNNGVATVSEAKLVKDAQYTVYTVGYDVDAMDYTKPILQAMASPGCFYESSADDISRAFQNILKSITRPVGTQGAVTDPIGDMFTYVDGSLSASSGAAVYDAAARTVRWDVGSLDASVDATLVYKVQIRDDAVAGTLYDTNGTAVLTYQDIDGHTASQSFPIPKAGVYGYTVGYYQEGADQPFQTFAGKAAPGSQVRWAAVTPPTGCQFSRSDPASGTLTVGTDSGRNVIRVYYAAIPVSYVVHYVDTAGRPIAADKTGSGLYGQTVTESPAAIAGYESLCTQSVSLPLGLTGNVITFQYAAVTVIPDGQVPEADTPAAPVPSAPAADTADTADTADAVTIADEQVPLADNPKTGSPALPFAGLAAGMLLLGGAAGAARIRRKKDGR